MIRLSLLLAIGAAAACSRGSSSMMSAGLAHGDFLESESAVSAVITGALEGEAAGAATDTLFVSSAVIVVNGRIRSDSPLLAGIGQGGQVVISSSQLEIRANSSWSVVDYRWESSGGVTREGRATFVLTQLEPGKWRIQHVHSSSPQ